MTARLGVSAVARILAASLLLIGCSFSPPDVASTLPTSVGGTTLVYDVFDGATAQDWAVEAATAARFPTASVTSATAFTAPGPTEYQSYALRVRGASGNAIVEPLLRSIRMDALPRRQETVGGMLVLRVDYQPGDPAYLYAFRDTVVMIYARRPAGAEDALRQLP